jgi:S-adenosylmethionine decarboxylase
LRRTFLLRPKAGVNQPKKLSNYVAGTGFRAMQKYDFYGRHLLLNFSGCEADLDDLERIRQDMVDAVNVIGATVLSQMEHQFDPHGVTVVLMLSESHASVHTYPEHNACFLDVFTCGETIDVRPFGELLKERWKPRWSYQQLHERYDPKELHLQIPTVAQVAQVGAR